MRDIREVLKEIELHDSALISLKINGDGLLVLEIDFDEVWNKELDTDIKGIIIHSVYEISEFKLDRFNVIGSVEIEAIDDYNKEFVMRNANESEEIFLVCIEFVAGGSLDIVCSGSASFLRSVS